MSDTSSTNNSYNNHNLTIHQQDISLLLMSSVGLLSICMCTLAIVIAIKLRLYKHFIYRMAMYQVLSSMLVGVDDVLSITLTSYISKYSPDFSHVMCYITAVMLTYFMWVKLLITVILTFHIFMLAVCLKNFKTFELMYIGISVVTPLLFVWVPFATHDYGRAGPWCWIQSKKLAGTIEQYALWYGPAYIFLVVCIVGGVIVAAVLLYRHYRSAIQSKGENMPLHIQPAGSNNHKKALTEVAPLLAYPLIFFVFNLFAAIHRIYTEVMSGNAPHVYGLILAHSIVNGLWGTLSSIAFCCHVVISRAMRKKVTFSLPEQAELSVSHKVEDVYTSYTEISTSAKSEYKIPSESEVERTLESIHKTDCT